MIKVGGYTSVVAGIISTLVGAIGLILFHTTFPYTFLLILIGFSGAGIVGNLIGGVLFDNNLTCIWNSTIFLY